MALEPLLKIASDIVDENEHKKREKFRPILDDTTVNYLARYGQPAKDWLRDQLHGFNNTYRPVQFGWRASEKMEQRIPGIPNPYNISLNDETINRIVDHVANGHISAVRELLLVDLIQQGHNRDKAKGEANYIFIQLLLRLASAQAADSNSALGTLQQIPKEIEKVLDLLIQDKNQRLICTHCYRVIREWNPKRAGGAIIEDGPSQVQCKQCGQVTPTFLIPWNKRSNVYKMTAYTVPAILIIVGILVIVALQDVACTVGSSLAIVGGLVWIFDTWRNSRKSLVIPVW